MSKPVADLFDLQFAAAGAVKDVSAGKVEVKSGGDIPSTYLNETFNRWAATFAGNGQSFYRVDYAQSTSIKNAFSNGFSFELLYKTNNTNNVCPLSAQESGGAGIEQANGGLIQFYCHVGGGYKVLKSSVTAKTGTYYHVVATYDKAAERICIYINGRPAGEMAAKGDFAFPSDVSARWIGIGGDAHGGNTAQFSLNGDIVVARMYGKAVSRDEAYLLYHDLTNH